EVASQTSNEAASPLGYVRSAHRRSLTSGYREPLDVQPRLRGCSEWHCAGGHRGRSQRGSALRHGRERPWHFYGDRTFIAGENQWKPNGSQYFRLSRPAEWYRLLQNESYRRGVDQAAEFEDMAAAFRFRAIEHDIRAGCGHRRDYRFDHGT